MQNLCKELENGIIEAQRKNKTLIFGKDTPVCRKSLNELVKQQIANERLNNQKSIKKTNLG